MKRFFFLFVIFFFSCLTLPAKADSYKQAIEYNDGSYNNYLADGQQPFVGSLHDYSENYNNISRIKFSLLNDQGSGVCYIYICESQTDLSTIKVTLTSGCETPTDQIGSATSTVGSGIMDFYINSQSYTYAKFQYNYNLHNVYYKIKCISGSSWDWIYQSTYLDSVGMMTYAIDPDDVYFVNNIYFAVTTYFNNTIATSTEPSVIYNYNPTELPSWIGDDDLKIADKLLCYTNNACFFPITYASSSVNDIIYLVQEYDLSHLVLDLQTSTTTTYAIASTTLPLNPFINRIGILLPVQTTATTSNICAYGYDDVQYEDYSVCRTEVKWIATSSLGVVCDYDIESACDNMASSTGGLLQDTLYGFGCGMRQAIYWAITPHCEAVTKLNDTYNRLQDSFPYSIFIQLKTIYTNTHATTTAFEFPILFAWSGATTTAFTQNSMYTVFGDAWDKLYKVMEYFIYTMFVVWFSLKIFNNQKDDS